MNQGLFLSCVADPTRLNLLYELARGDATVGDLVDRTGHTQPNVSHHLKQLRSCGLVQYAQDGKCHRYRLSHPVLYRFLAMVDEATQALQPLCTCEVCA